MTAMLIGENAQTGRHYFDAEQKFRQVFCPSSASEAIAMLESDRAFSFCAVDIDSIAGSMSVALIANHERAPGVVFALHARPVTTDDAFALARWGVARLLPVEIDLASELAKTEPLAPPFRRMASELVGRRTLFEMERSLRKACVEEALDRCRGNRTQAAALLAVPRVVVQREIRETRTTKTRKRTRSTASSSAPSPSPATLSVSSKWSTRIAPFH